MTAKRSEKKMKRAASGELDEAGAPPMKGVKQKSAVRTGEKRGVEERRVPTLGQVAEEARFDPLWELLEPVKDTPVDKLGKELRAWLKEEAMSICQLPLALSFIDDCDARAEQAAPKRVHVAFEEHSPGKQQRWLFFFFCFFFFFVLLHSLFWTPGHRWCEEGSVCVLCGRYVEEKRARVCCFISHTFLCRGFCS